MHVKDVDPSSVADALKPVLRGWLHAGWTPVVVAGCAALVALAPTATGRWSSLVFGITAVLLFGTSAIYHRGSWTPRARAFLRRLDHSNIFLIIVGSYTPLSALLLPRDQAITLLSVVWGGALLGILLNLVFIRAPRWVGVPIYIALGWAAVFYLPSFVRSGGWGVTSLVIAGGLLYTVGALVYAMKWPNPSPKVFGFHEVFHGFTVAAFVCHFIAIAMVVLGAAPERISALPAW